MVCPLPAPRRIFVAGASGTIGRATVRALIARGHEVVGFLRGHDGAGHLVGATLRFGQVTDPASLARDGFRGERFDAVISCLASRTGVAADAWAIDHGANLALLAAARDAGVAQFVLLSAICVQKPVLAFQHAKLAFEQVLRESGLTYSIVRPTAYFKSLSGQLDRLRRGKPFLMFGDGALTECMPISDDDLGRFLVDCLDDASLHDRVLPIGGPGPAITPRQQGELLFAALGQPPRFRHVPVAFLDLIVGVLGLLGQAFPSLAAKAELARIGRYYATESMLLLDHRTGRYDPQATPSTGSETLFAFYQRLVAGEAILERRDQAVF